MEEYRGTLLWDGEVVLASVPVFLGRSGVWNGYFLLPPGQDLTDGAEYHLDLGDDRPRRVELLTRHFNARAETPVLFRFVEGQGRPGRGAA